jgi:cyclic pyranopterin phosphate synthase
VHTNLRISVTDRCNIRCFYCMPAEDVEFLPKSDLLSFEELERVARVAAGLGIDRIRLTGGEPLVRRDLPLLVQKLAAIPGIRDLGMTTNGILLAGQASSLREAGLSRLNISLDALDPDVFRRVTRREGYEQVLEGIAAARQGGFFADKDQCCIGAGSHGGPVGPLWSPCAGN